ncbi:hypothetical protein OF83DRAFT_1122690 [Amylostereum chailletii]|nr:hypothetical protein OF83DRAFT_1122690 [Amylostereum chailletii]
MRCAAFLCLSVFFVLVISSLLPAAHAAPILPRDVLTVRCPSYECRNAEVVSGTTASDDMQSKLNSLVDAVIMLLSGFKASLADGSTETPSPTSSEPSTLPSAPIDISTVSFTPDPIVAASTPAPTPSATST